jgi:hypothetical protein
MFLRPIVPGLVSATLLIAAIVWAKQYILVATWEALILDSITVGLIYTIAVWLVGLTRAEHELILKLVPQPIRRIVATIPILLQ